MTTYTLLTTKELRRIFHSRKLIELAEHGRIQVTMTKEPEQKKRKKEDLEEYQQFAHLKDDTTWISKASRDYAIPFQTISRWIQQGVIRVVGQEKNRKLISAQDVAYCAFVYRHQCEGCDKQGRWIFDREGLPYKKGE